MTQVPSLSVASAPGVTVREGFNALADAINTGHRGNTAPPEAVPGMFWQDTSTTPITVRIRTAANTWIAFGTIDEAAGAFTPSGGVADGLITFAKLAAAAVRASTEGLTSTTNTELPTSAWVEARTMVKAWVVFDGTTGGILGTGSFNVLSVTRLGTGDYRINFAAAQPDTNFAVLAQSGPATDTSSVLAMPVTERNLTNCRVLLRNDGGLQRDSSYIAVAILR